MLEKLFGSKARVKILKLFLSHPEKKFYIRQIARDQNLQLNSVRRELENLETFGLLTSRPMDKDEEKRIEEEVVIQTIGDVAAAKTKKSGKKAIPLVKSDKKYFRTNPEFILFEELKALVVKAQVLYEKDFIEKLNKAGQPKLLILAGFFVGNQGQPVDILLVGRLNKNYLLKLIRELERDLGREINFCLFSSQEFKYRRDITDVFLYDILEKRNLKVIDEIGLS